MPAACAVPVRAQKLGFVCVLPDAGLEFVAPAALVDVIVRWERSPIAGNVLAFQTISTVRQRECAAAFDLRPIIPTTLAVIGDGAVGGTATQNEDLVKYVSHQRIHR